MSKVPSDLAPGRNPPLTVSALLRGFFLGRYDAPPVAKPLVFDTDAGFRRSGEDLIEEIGKSILLRRSVLITGPRGCGKSYCAEQAIRRAVERGIIGGWHFLQGNREIPRETLSEDSLTLNPAGKPQLLQALALRSVLPDNRRDEVYRKRILKLEEKHRDFPGIRSQVVNGRAGASEFWDALDWGVLYLDEITRFADGFLDSLLSLTEEGKIVRRGEDYYVPLIVVATANPPGYDPTAKRLSPPLQARIASSYAVLQPPIELLAKAIAWDRLVQVYKELGVPEAQQIRSAEDKVVYLASAVCLCLWGNPSDPTVRGLAYLDHETCNLLAAAMAADQELAEAMRTLSALVTFGPDARAVCDWLARGVAEAKGLGETLALKHLAQSAESVLPHKVRENFNEGTEPAKKRQLNGLVKIIVTRVFENEALLDEFMPPFAPLAQRLRDLGGPAAACSRETLRAGFDGLGPGERRRAWLRALSRLPRAVSLESWLAEARQLGALTTNAEGATLFLDDAEKRWAVGFLTMVGLVDHVAFLEKVHVRLDTDLAVRLRRSPVLIEFAEILSGVALQPDLSAFFADQTRMQAWVEALDQIFTPTTGIDRTAPDSCFWELVRTCVPTPSPAGQALTIRDLAAPLQTACTGIRRRANEVGRARAHRMLAQLDAAQDIDETALGRAWNAGEAPAGTDASAFPLARLALDLSYAEVSRSTKRVAAWVRYLTRLAEHRAAVPPYDAPLLESARKLALEEGILSNEARPFFPHVEEWRWLHKTDGGGLPAAALDLARAALQPCRAAPRAFVTQVIRRAFSPGGQAGLLDATPDERSWPAGVRPWRSPLNYSPRLTRMRTALMEGLLDSCRDESTEYLLPAVLAQQPEAAVEILATWVALDSGTDASRRTGTAAGIWKRTYAAAVRLANASDPMERSTRWQAAWDVLVCLLRRSHEDGLWPQAGPVVKFLEEEDGGAMRAGDPPVRSEEASPYDARFAVAPGGPAAEVRAAIAWTLRGKR